MTSNLETIILNDKMGIFDGIFKHLNEKEKSQNLDENAQYLIQYITDIKKQNPNISKEKLQEILLLKQQQEKKQNPNIDLSRRNALKTLGIGAVLLTTAPNTIIDLVNKTFDKEILYKNEAKADYNYKDIPPGIATCRDRHIKQAYVLVRDENWREYYHGVKQIKIFEGIMDITDNNYFPMEFGKVNPNTPYIEPAYWFLCAMMNDLNKNIFDKLKKKNHILYEFAYGIINYFHEFVYRNKGYYGMQTEKHLLNSIFGAAYGEDKMDSMTKQYLNSDFEEKTTLIKNTTKIFQNMHIDPTNNQINDNYDKALTAQWAAFWLVGYYERKKNKCDDIIWNLENYGFKKMNNSQNKNDKIDLRIRGPPYYNY